MTWIDTVEPSEAEGRVKDVYDRMKEAWGTVSPAFAVMSRDPPYLQAMWDLHRTVMRAGRLTEAQKESLALAVSVVNGCGFCIWAHAGRLRSLGVNGERVAALKANPVKAPLPPEERALVAWAVKATRDPEELTEEDVRHLEDWGWDEEALTEAAAVVGHLNHLNRILDALGVRAPSD